MRLCLLVGCLVFGGCSVGSRSAADSLVVFGAGPAVSQCRLKAPIPGSRDSIAVKCAEAFVARNGYTNAPADDSTLIAYEFIAPGRGAVEILKHRHNTLAPRAILLCHDRRERPGFTIAFARPGDSALSQARAVTMDTSLDKLRIEHVDFLPRVAAESPGCAWLPGVGH